MAKNLSSSVSFENFGLLFVILFEGKLSYLAHVCLRVIWSAPDNTQDDPDVTWDGKEMPKTPDKMPKTLDCLSKAFLLLEHGRRRESNKSGG